MKFGVTIIFDISDGILGVVPVGGMGMKGELGNVVRGMPFLFTLRNRNIWTSKFPWFPYKEGSYQ